MKIINASFYAENEYAENQIWNHLESLGAKHMKTLPNTDHLEEDKHFKKLMKEKKDQQKRINKYIDNNRK